MPHQPRQTRPQPGNHHPPSSATGTNSGHPSSVIVETLEHRRFAEFCDACRRYGYIGLCYGPPGVGKTLSAWSYSRWDKVNQAARWGTGPTENPALDTVFYTPAVVNAPGNVSADIRRSRDTLRDLARQPLRLEREERLDTLLRRDKEHLAKLLDEDRDWLTEPVPELHPTYGEVTREYLVKDMQLCDPTTLILTDEADRLRMTSLEQVRAIFDAGTIGVILIGMPGLEKRLARYPQFYSRIGFVHEFRPLDAAAVRQLLEQGWTPPGVRLPQLLADPEVVAAIIRITGGNFRLLNRLLTQMERILEINALPAVTKAVVEAARESLVIGAV
ncbi:MAG: AAA family ATPase [Candidatus Binataceae bacterium]